MIPQEIRLLTAVKMQRRTAEATVRKAVLKTAIAQRTAQIVQTVRIAQTARTAQTKILQNNQKKLSSAKVEGSFFVFWHRMLKRAKVWQHMRAQVISWSQAKKYIYYGDTLFVDLRDEETYKEGHIRGAWNIPYNEFLTNIEQMKKYRRIIFCCDYGTHSLMAAKRMAQVGIQAYSIAGGYRYGVSQDNI